MCVVLFQINLLYVFKTKQKMTAKKSPTDEVLSAKILRLKGSIKLPKNFNYKTALVKVINDKYRLKR